MDDISARLTEILNDPESLERVRTMAEGILGDHKQQTQTSSPDLSSVLSGEGLDGVQLAKILSIISRLKTSGNDNRSRLLLALKPHLSSPKQEKVDTAIKLLKLIDLLPLLRESGLFEF